MLLNKSDKTVTAWWDGKSVVIEPGAKFDVRDLDVIQSDLPAVEDRMIKKYGVFERVKEDRTQKASSGPSEAGDQSLAEGDEGGHNAAVNQAIAEGEKKLKELGDKKDAKSKADAKKIAKQLESLRATLK